MQPIMRNHYFEWFSFGYASFIFIITFNQPFFWDTIQLGSKQAYFFYDNNFNSLLLPDEIDSGHFPLFGIFLAAFWKLLGKTLFYSHLAMLPINFLLTLGICRWSALFFKGKWLWVMTFLLLAEPAFTTQMQLISPDVILMTAFVWVVWGIYKRNNSILIFAFTVLCLISLRGLLIGMGIFSFFMWRYFFKHEYKHGYYNDLKISLPGLSLSLGYMLFHWYAKRWIGFHQNSPWAESFVWVDPHQMVKNIALIIWRFADHGRILVLIFLLFVLWMDRKLFVTDVKIRNGILLLICVAVPLVVPGIVFSHLAAHRYYMPMYFLLIFGLGWITYNSSLKANIKNVIVSFSFISLLTGHLWKYPNHIAQGWDCVLMHRSYFSLHEKMIEFMRNHNINKNEVATFFPSIASAKVTHLNSDTTAFLTWNDPKAVYVYFSSVHNDAPDDIWKRVKTIKPIWFKKEGLIQAGLYRLDDIELDK